MKNDFHKSPKKIYVLRLQKIFLSCLLLLLLIQPLSRIISYRDHLAPVFVISWKLSRFCYCALTAALQQQQQQQLCSNFSFPLLLITSFAWIPLHNYAKYCYFRITFFLSPLNWMLTCCCEIGIFFHSHH